MTKTLIVRVNQSNIKEDTEFTWHRCTMIRNFWLKHWLKLWLKTTTQTLLISSLLVTSNHISIFSLKEWLSLEKCKGLLAWLEFQLSSDCYTVDPVRVWEGRELRVVPSSKKIHFSIWHSSPGILDWSLFTLFLPPPPYHLFSSLILQKW